LQKNWEDDSMRITIQYFEGCPHWNLADTRVKNALRDSARNDVDVDYQLIDSPEAAESSRFRGSPTILIDGRDPFAKGDEAFGLSCRIYDTGEGPQGAPTEAQLSALFTAA